MNTIDLSKLDETGVNASEQDPHGYCPHCGIYLDNGVGMHDPSEGFKNETHLWSCLGCGGEFGPLLRKRKGVSHEGKKGSRNAVSVKAWLQANKDATYAEALAYVKSTGRSEITLKIQMRNLGLSLK
jgi:hypothetical protein